MEENNNKMSELEKLMHKTEKAMEMTREKSLLIDIMEEDLMNETRPMMVEKRKTEIDDKKQEKAEFDEMTVEALRRAKTEVLKIREQSEKEYQEKLIETVEKRNTIARKLKSMEEKELPEEKLAMAKASADKALTKVNEEMKTYQEKYFVKKAKLDEFEAKINNFGIELGVGIEPLKESEQKVEGKEGNNKLEENKTPTVVDEKTPEKENKKDTSKEVDEGAEVKENSQKEPERPKAVSVEVKDNKYIFTWELKEDGIYDTAETTFEKLGFFKGLFEKAKLVANRKEYGIGFMSAMRADVNIYRNLNDKDKEKYLNYLASQTASCFDIKYHDENNRKAKALAKAQERIALKEANALEQYGPEQELDLDEDIIHDLQQSKYEEMFGKGFDQHDNPPAISPATKEELDATDVDKLIDDVKKLVGTDER